MSDVTLEKAVNMKQKLSRDILKLITEYEQNCSGVCVKDLELFQNRTMCGNKETISVVVNVEF